MRASSDRVIWNRRSRHHASARWVLTMSPTLIRAEPIGFVCVLWPRGLILDRRLPSVLPGFRLAVFHFDLGVGIMIQGAGVGSQRECAMWKGHLMNTTRNASGRNF